MNEIYINYLLANSLVDSRLGELLEMVNDSNVFFKHANKSGSKSMSRRRIFGLDDYEIFLDSCETAVNCALNNEPYYFEMNGGKVSNSYKYKALTSYFGIYTKPDGLLEFKVCRKQCNGNIKCIFTGGKRMYNLWFEASKNVLNVLN